MIGTAYLPWAWRYSRVSSCTAVFVLGFLAEARAEEGILVAEVRAEAAGTPHWRQALADPAIALALAEADLAAPISSTWREGALADALVAARSASDRLSAALDSWAVVVAERVTAGSPGYAEAEAFGAAIARYLIDPTAAYDPSDARPMPSALKEGLDRGRAALSGFDASLMASREALARSLAAYTTAADPARLVRNRRRSISCFVMADLVIVGARWRHTILRLP